MFSETKIRQIARRKGQGPSSLNACGLPFSFREDIMESSEINWGGWIYGEWVRLLKDLIREREQEIRQARQAEMVGAR